MVCLAAAIGQLSATESICVMHIEKDFGIAIEISRCSADPNKSLKKNITSILLVSVKTKITEE
jgi:hypothetical protein